MQVWLNYEAYLEFSTKRACFNKSIIVETLLWNSNYYYIMYYIVQRSELSQRYINNISLSGASAFTLTIGYSKYICLCLVCSNDCFTLISYMNLKQKVKKLIQRYKESVYLNAILCSFFYLISYYWIVRL